MTIPEIEPIVSIEIKTLITQLELYDRQIQSIDTKIDQMMKLIDSKIMSIPGIGDALGPIILGEIGSIDRFSSPKILILNNQGCYLNPAVGGAAIGVWDRNPSAIKRK